MENSDPTHPFEYLIGVLYHIIQNAQETPLSYKIPAALNEMVSLKRSKEVLEQNQIQEQVSTHIYVFICKNIHFYWFFKFKSYNVHCISMN